MSRRDVWTGKTDPRRAKAAVKKKIEIIDAPVLRNPPPDVVELEHLPQDLVDLLPPITPASRQALVDHMADVAMVLLRQAGYIDPDVRK
jgi:hypothetical protein